MRFSKNKLLLCSMLTVGLWTPHYVHAEPKNAIIRAGDANISYTGNKTDIHQSSSKAIIDWRSFDIAPNEHTEFHQPSSSSVTLNRINDTKSSRIDGQLTANGHIMLINPNGVVFGAGSKVNVGSLTASTADIDNNDFMAENYNFKHSGNSNAQISNQGIITVAEAGLVTLVAPRVANNGIIIAKLGKAQLAAADTFAIDMAGDGLIQIAVSEDEAAKIVQNSGLISSEGGYVSLTAGQARNILDSRIEHSGIIEASSMTSVGGKVMLTANQGQTKVSGSINASGKTGGGEVLIGGDTRGENNLVTNSTRTEIEETATIKANATDSGDGGKVIVWADGQTVMSGSIEAQGGVNGGGGGFVETSGKEALNVRETANVDASARQEGYESGSWLLDPSNVVLVNGGAQNVPGGGGTVDPSADNFMINIATLQTALNANNNVIITTVNSAGTENGDITVQDAISWSGSSRLTLDANNTIYVNNTITSTHASGDLYLRANNFAINSTLNGIGALTFDNQTRNRSMGIGDGVAGSNSISNAMLDNISANWDSITFDSYDGSLNVAARNWNSNVFLYSNLGATSVEGDQNMGIHDLTFGARRTIDINSPISGSGALTFAVRGASSESMRIGDDAIITGGGVHISDASLNNITDGWNSILFKTFGNTNSVMVFDTAAAVYKFKDPVTFQHQKVLTLGSNIGAAVGSNASITFDGQNTTNSVHNINGNIDLSDGDGTGSVIFKRIGTLNLSADIMTGGGNIDFQNTIVNLNILSNARFDVASGLFNLGTSGLAAGANNVTINADEIDLAANLTSTGIVTLTAGTLGTDINLGSAITSAEVLDITDAELERIAASKLVIGSNTAGSGDVDIEAIDVSAKGYNLEIYGNGITTTSLKASDSLLLLANGGTITLNNNISATGAGNSVVLVGNRFINNAGSNAIDPGAGRFLIYSADPSNDTRGGLAYNFKRYNKSYTGYAPASVAEAGNGILFSVAPTLTIKADDATREVGQPNVFTSSISGYIDGDTAVTNDVVSGIPSLNSIANAGSPTGGYAITSALGSLASNMGYQFSFSPGLLTVIPDSSVPPTTPVAATSGSNSLPNTVQYNIQFSQGEGGQIVSLDKNIYDLELNASNNYPESAGTMNGNLFEVTESVIDYFDLCHQKQSFCK